MKVIEVEIFKFSNGKAPFLEFIKDLSLKNRVKASKSIISRVEKIEKEGYFGDHKSLGDGLFELRIFLDGGFRVYYTEKDGKLVILLTAGMKKSQEKDIAKAREYLKMYEER